MVDQSEIVQLNEDGKLAIDVVPDKMLDDVGVALAARTYAYEAWRCLFGSSPSSGLLRGLGGSDFRSAISVICGEEAGAVEAVADAAVSQSGDVEHLRDEYTRCFVGPGKLPAYPWESVNLEADGALFGDSTLAVRRTYAAHGMQSKRRGSEPDDYIALELQFMEVLAKRTADNWCRGDRASCASNLKASASFLDEHLNRWVPLYAAAFVENGERGFYGCAAEGLQQFLEADRVFLEELRPVIESAS